MLDTEEESLPDPQARPNARFLDVCESRNLNSIDDVSTGAR